MSQCKHLTCSWATCAPLMRGRGVNPRGLLPVPYGRWALHITLCYMHVLIDTFSFYVYALVLAKENASQVIKALKSATLIGVPWALKTNSTLPTPLTDCWFPDLLENWPHCWHSLQSTNTDHCEGTNRYLKAILQRSLHMRLIMIHLWLWWKHFSTWIFLSLMIKTLALLVNTRPHCLCSTLLPPG